MQNKKTVVDDLSLGRYYFKKSRSMYVRNSLTSLDHIRTETELMMKLSWVVNLQKYAEDLTKSEKKKKGSHLKKRVTFFSLRNYIYTIAVLFDYFAVGYFSHPFCYKFKIT